MVRFLANENTPREAVLAAHDVEWIVERQPDARDEWVLALAHQEGRVLITFDKDFGELVFRKGRAGSPGVILLRPRLRSPEILADFIVKVLSQSINWAGHFTVARERRLRVVPLP